MNHHWHPSLRPSGLSTSVHIFFFSFNSGWMSLKSLHVSFNFSQFLRIELCVKENFLLFRAKHKIWTPHYDHYRHGFIPFVPSLHICALVATCMEYIGGINAKVGCDFFTGLTGLACSRLRHGLTWNCLFHVSTVERLVGLCNVVVFRIKFHSLQRGNISCGLSFDPTSSHELT